MISNFSYLMNSYGGILQIPVNVPLFNTNHPNRPLATLTIRGISNSRPIHPGLWLTVCRASPACLPPFSSPFHLISPFPSFFFSTSKSSFLSIFFYIDTLIKFINKFVLSLYFKMRVTFLRESLDFFSN